MLLQVDSEALLQADHLPQGVYAIPRSRFAIPRSRFAIASYTDSWVFAALTNFKGRLQARDIVRFLYNADIY
ncbi:hypothetical protein [Aphanizomenon flos-aquae]|uniref:hypothetical protein n=1 Tax=Aphanizomenon flos-aquae TaxID=1176 RepID=UPI000489C6E0|nr:hypothetical protein [Aphanizomenon flos-aquae]